MKPSYLEVLKDFVEGKKDLREWPAWWQENGHIIQENEGCTLYLKLKHDWQEGAYNILKQHGIEYVPNREVNWNRCMECGETLFNAIPHKTTKEQIREFLKNSIYENELESQQDPWIHPGVYCPKGCTRVLINYKNGTDE